MDGNLTANILDTIREKDVDRAIKTIKDELDRNKRMISDLREENTKLKYAAYQDEELQKMKTELEETRKDYNRGFPISEEEHKHIKAWMTEHEKRHSNYSGAIGGGYTYCFIPTSIGIIGTVKCTCGAEFTFRELS